MDPTDKRAHLLEALKGGVVLLHVDARKPGVVVPEALRDFFDLRLNVSLRYAPGDLDIDAWGLRCTLSFDRQPFKVALPWEAIFGLLSRATGELWIYPADVPQEWEPPEPPRPRGRPRLVN